MELLILADDLTGALDTGIQFVKRGVRTSVVFDPAYPLEKVDQQVQVLVVDTESRHIDSAKAAEIVEGIVRKAVSIGVQCIYKKTDSALRGNVGAELGAALKASGQAQLHFIPAFPDTKRSTVGGIHYIDKVPVADSVFGKDPFNPVKYSRVADVLAAQTDAPVFQTGLKEDANDQPGIQVYDAVTNEDILQRGLELKQKGKLKVLAGCAGFAGILSELMEMGGQAQPLPEAQEPFFMVCGSVNPITRTQVKNGVASGKFQYIQVPPEQTLTPHWFTIAEGKAELARWNTFIQKKQPCIVDTNDIPGAVPVAEYAARQGFDIEEVRRRIPLAMGEALKGLLDAGACATWMVTGGDILMGFIQTMGIYEITPLQELFTGTVLSKITVHGREQLLISKSGGFGDEQLLPNVLAKLFPKYKEEK